MPIWKPTARECELIKHAAAREAGIKPGRVLLEPASRCNTKDDSKNEAACKIARSDYNVALVSDDPDWSDTDLNDYGSWSEFRKGVALTDDGRAIVDFYIRARLAKSYDDDLLGNIVVEFADGRISRIRGYPGEYPIQ